MKEEVNTLKRQVQELSAKSAYAQFPFPPQKPESMPLFTSAPVLPAVSVPQPANAVVVVEVGNTHQQVQACSPTQLPLLRLDQTVISGH